MNFKEFFENEEREFFEIGLDEIFGSGLKFLGGVGGNFVSQLARGAGNAISGVGGAALGTGQTALAGLQAIGGGRKKAGETIRNAGENLKSGGGNILRGAAQLAGALTGVSPVLRGAQATSEPLGISGVYAPGSSNRTFAQDLLGLDSWEKEKTTTPNSTTRQASPNPKKTSIPKEDPAVSYLKDLERKEKSKILPQPPEWKELVVAYKSAKTKEEQDKIIGKMRQMFPSLYLQAVEAGKKGKKK